MSVVLWSYHLKGSGVVAPPAASGGGGGAMPKNRRKKYIHEFAEPELEATFSNEKAAESEKPERELIAASSPRLPTSKRSTRSKQSATVVNHAERIAFLVAMDLI